MDRSGLKLVNLLSASNKKEFTVHLISSITVLLLILAGSPFFNIVTGIGADAASNPYVPASISNLANSDATSSGSFIFWDTNVSSDNRIYYGLNEADVNNLVNGTWSHWDNNTFNVSIRLSGLSANATYYYKPESWHSGLANNSVPASAIITLRPGVWVNPSEYMVSPAGWMPSPENFRTVNISAAPLNSNGRYITGLSLEAVIYNSTDSEIGRTGLSGNGPYSGNFILPDYLDEGGYVVRINGYPIAGEFSVLGWGCSSCHVGPGANYPSTFDPGTVHPGHFDTTNIYVVHDEQVITSTTQCAWCHRIRPPSWVAHPNDYGCSNCHRLPSGTTPALSCENCHNDRTTNQNILSQRYGQDKHLNQACSNCHGSLTSLNTKPGCTTCHPGPGSNLTTVPDSISDKSHSTDKTVACGICHNSEHDVKSLALDAKTCRSCHTGITHDGGAQCASCHGSDPHEITSAGGEACIECHGTNYPDANPMAKTTLVDISAFGESIHLNINATPPDTVNNDDCWSCHYNKDMNRQNIRKCGDCHTKPQQWHGNANITTNISKLW
ncbi:MAG: cytochrome c3 family protein [Candidatus Methanoperedens sp.]|nr:cytochrome c3 family protein [Candidatus Methanoperedens sp.]